jgi:hypothetical protein
MYIGDGLYGNTEIYSIDMDSSYNMVIGGIASSSTTMVSSVPFISMYDYDTDALLWTKYVYNPSVP